MNPRWLGISTLIAIGGVVAGVLAFVGARLFFPGHVIPLTAGLLTVIVVDVALVLVIYPRLTAGSRDEDIKD